MCNRVNLRRGQGKPCHYNGQFFVGIDCSIKAADCNV